MHIKAQLGGKYTHVTVDIPVPVAGWLWQKLYRKYFEKGDIEAKIDAQKSEELSKLRCARKLFDEAVKLQTDISEKQAKDYQNEQQSKRNVQELRRAKSKDSTSNRNGKSLS